MPSPIVPLSDRITFLRARLDQILPAEPSGPDWYARVDDSPLSEPFHDAWMGHEGTDPRLQLAHAIAADLAAARPLIHPGELIIGAHDDSRIISARTTPFGDHFRLNLPRAEALKQAHPPSAPQVEEIVSYWQQWLVAHPYACGPTCHVSVAHERVLELGLDGLRAYVAQWRDRNVPERPEVAPWYEALLIVVDGLSAFVTAHAEAAERLAATAETDELRDELHGIAERCRHVAHGKPRSFAEAVQLFYLSFLALGGHCSPGPVDRMLWPALRDDLERGSLSLPEAQELVDCLWLKFAERTAHGATLAGQLPDGSDGANPLSHLCLESIRRLRLLSPRTAVRWHRGLDPDFFAHACEVTAEGLSFPVFINDEAVVAAAVARGEKLEHAREYTFVGCGQVYPHGRGHGNYEDLVVNAATPLLQALHDVSPEATFEGLLEAWRARFAEHVGGLTASVNQRRRDCAGQSWDLLRSLLTQSCIERGLDWHEGGADYSEGMVDVVGLTTALDSLFAVKTAVFEEGRLSLAELVAALDDDWAGHEDLRQYLLRQVPKFGNDDAVVDAFVAEEAAWVDEHIRSCRTAFGGPWGMDIIGWSGALIFGEGTEATPDGRRRGDSLADCAGPAQGRNVKGLTATLNSVLKLPHATAHGPLALSLRFPKEALRAEEGRQHLQAVVETYFRGGGQQLQITVASTEELRAALAHPEEHRSLIVRVGGFSAYFTQLDPRWQQDMIERAEMG